MPYTPSETEAQLYRLNDRSEPAFPEDDVGSQTRPARRGSTNPSSDARSLCSGQPCKKSPPRLTDDKPSGTGVSRFWSPSTHLQARYSPKSILEFPQGFC